MSNSENRDNNEVLVLPALKAHMGIWHYYISFMKMSEVVKRINIVQQIHSSKRLQELLQRSLEPRAEDIAEYLKTQDQRFFNSLVVGAYGGNPNWFELSIRDMPITFSEELPDYIKGALGILRLDGHETLFAIDGQHRVQGIRDAIRDDPKLANEEISVIFVAAITQTQRDKDPEGFQRTRRLFTTLNKYAKPVGKKDTIALDEDDAVAIITRDLVEDYSLFQEKISLRMPKSVSVKDKQSFTSIIALYDCLNIYLSMGSATKAWKRFRTKRPSDDKLKELYKDSTRFWDTLCKYFPQVQEMKESKPEKQVAGQYRSSDGGHLLFRPMGLLITTRVIRNLMFYEKLSLDAAIERISKVPMMLSNKPWVGLLWDPSSSVMKTEPENQKAAELLMFYSVGGHLAKLKVTEDDLRKKLAGRLNIEKKEVELLRYP
ncbi:MAG: DGQHR domain-containing protein [Thaumarchaeota archaeon]|nr:DGQHR domain-containing protein [Nitrososphaerota archaeon]